MILYIVQRLALLPLLMLIYSFVIFAIIQAPPGDFLSAYVATLASSGSSISADQIAALRHQYGLDQPFVVQYLLWMQNLFHGDFGLSLEYQRPNADLIGEQIGLTPMVQGVVVANVKFRNVPTTLGNDWPLRSPGNARTEQFYFAK